MPSKCRVGDVGIGTCCCHSEPTCRNKTGVIITGTGRSNANSIPSSRATDVVMATCGHVGIIVGGSSTANSEGLSDARVGDSFSGCFTGVLMSGSSNINTGG